MNFVKNSFKLRVAFLVSCLMSLPAVADYTYVTAYVDTYSGDSQSSYYSGYILDVSQMGLTEAASASSVAAWLKSVWTTDFADNAAIVSAMTYRDYDATTGSLGFYAGNSDASLSALSLDGAGGQYYFAALYTLGGYGASVYGDILSYSDATTTSSRLDFDVGGEQLAGSSTQSGWAQIGMIPEPSSGLLILLGFAALALKRRRA